MNKNTLSLKNIIVDQYGSLKHNEHNLVIFKDNFTDHDWYSNGYLESANELVDGLLELEYTRLAGNDIKVFPILYLYIHSLELSLKKYLNRLRDHFSRKSCDDLPTPSKNIDSIVRSHDLQALFNKICLLVDNDNMHGNKEFLKLKDFIDSIEELGLDNESLRYVEGKNEVKHKLLSTQRWVKLLELKEVFNNVHAFLWTSINDDAFYLCEMNEFKAGMLKELIYIKELLQGIRKLVEPKYFKSTTELGQIDIDKLQENLLKQLEYKKEIENAIKDFDEKKLALINKGIAFSSSPAINVNNKEYYEQFSKADNKRHFCEDYLGIDEAIKRIQYHIDYVDGKIKSRTK